MSRKARSVSLTTYSINTPEFLNRFVRRPFAAVFHVLQPLPDSFRLIGLRRNVQQSLVGLGVLHHRFCLPVYREDYRLLRFLELAQELRRVPPERRHCLNIFL